MDKKSLRDFRPEIHFTAPYGWLNDPNGMVYENGNYHLFYQYHPFDTVWGPMYWGHAVTTDLIRWKNLPVAMAPDEIGAIWSGSAVYDAENTSGFEKDGKAPIVAMFTHHYHEPETDQAADYEQQSIAYSTDGVHFTKYEGNPVLPSQKRDYRDPKMFRNPVKNCWGMVLAAGDHAEFYASKDLKEWEKTGEFGPEGNLSEGVWECPDFFPLQYGDETKWVLIVSMGINETNPNKTIHGSRTQYFLGSFDGDTFTPDGSFDQAEFIDYGLDNYAGVTFDNADERILIGWAANWAYANALPTDGFCGIMTVPRALTLVDTPKGGVRLASKPVSDGCFSEGVPSDGTLPGEVFKLTVTGSGASAVTLSNEAGQQFTFGVNENNEAYIDRTKAGACDFSPVFASNWYSFLSAPRLYDGAWTLELTFDRSVCELFLDGGTRAFTQLVFPDLPYTTVSATGNASVRIHTLK